MIEAGARCVTLAFSRWPFGRMLKGDYNWDWHKDLFTEARGTLPLFDLGLSALIEDLDDRGLLDETLVVAWGEFGRTPKINKNAGRDHWPKVGGALLAGGGLRYGQVVGSTTRLGEEPRTRPVHFREVFATLYHRLGIDVDERGSPTSRAAAVPRRRSPADAGADRKRVGGAAFRGRISGAASVTVRGRAEDSIGVGDPGAHPGGVILGNTRRRGGSSTMEVAPVSQGWFYRLSRSRRTTAIVGAAQAATVPDRTKVRRFT